MGCESSQFVWLVMCLLVNIVLGQSPAKIVQSLHETRAIAGESVLFACQAEGNPLPRLVFRWNGQEITHSRPGLQLKVTSPDSLSLRAKLEMSHSGDVVSCMAENQVGSDVSSARITVYSANETPPRGFPKVIQDPSATISQVGSSAHLQCDVSADPTATVSWIKDHFYLVDLSQSRFRIAGSGSLVIENLQESDSGSYECMASNVLGTVLSNSGHLHVRRNLTIAFHYLQQQGIQFPPSIHEMPDWVNVAPGQRANLTCRAGGFPVPMVWWSTAGSPIGPENLTPLMMTERPLTEPQQYEATLRLTDITESHDYYCMAKNGLGLVRRNVSVIVTELPLAPSEVDVRPIGGTHAVIWWSPSNSSDVDSYTLTIETDKHDLGKLGRRQLANLQPALSPNPSKPEKLFHHYNLTDLIPYTNYVVRVHSVSRTAGLSLPSKPVEFRTAELAPGSSPQALYANVVSSNSVMISWKAPKEPNGRITGYKVYHTTRPEDPLNSWLVNRVQEERLHLTDLILNATYYTRVSAYTTAGDGPTTEILPILVTPGVPSAPSNFQGQAIDSTSIQLSWQPPELPGDVKLQGYKLRYRASQPPEANQSPRLESHQTAESTQTVTLSSDLSEYRLEDLQPSTLYHISLVGQTVNGFGVGAQIEVTTKDQSFQLSKPVGVHLQTVTTNTAKLCWKRPQYPRHHNFTLSYELLFGPAEEAVDVADATGVIELPLEQCCCFTMMNLIPGHNYRVWLRFVRKSTQGQVWSTTERTVGPVSDAQAFRTLLAVPGIPQGRKILVHGPTTIQVTWNGPRERLADVRHYKLTWNCVDCSDDHKLTEISSQFNGRVNFKGQRNVLANHDVAINHLYTATINDLLPDRPYQVSLSAANARGVGKAYMYPIVRTAKQAPLRPKNLQLVNIHKRPRPQAPPPDLTGYHSTQDSSYLSVELAWDPPDELRTSQQISYQVYVRLIGPEDVLAELSEQESNEFDPEAYRSAQNQMGHSGLSPLLQRHLLANVTGNTFRSSESDNIGYGMTYQFEVSLFNGSTSGPPARLNVTTPEAAPLTSPLHVRLSGLSSNAVEVSWSPPPIHYRNGRITAYQVRYFEVGAETQTETLVKVTEPGQRQYTAKNLKEKTYYTFMVRAFTSAGHGPWSGASNIRTSVELPPPPIDIRATRINQHQIKVTWQIPGGDDQGIGPGSSAIQGFRLLYSPNNNPYEAGQWTSFDVGPVNMAIISHLDSKSSYVICIKSRGQDGRYGDCSQPVIGRTANIGTEPDFSVRNLLCTGDHRSVKVTWQQPVRTKKLEGFKLRVGGSKKFTDATGVLRSLEFPARSVSVAYAAVHSGYTYTVSDLEPNSIYDVQVSAYYDMSLSMESNWETTSCYTQMERPSFVLPPIPVAVSPARRQVLLQLARLSERYGKIRHYFLVVAPIHLANSETAKIDIENTITTSRGLPSSGTRYVAAKYQQTFFDPPPRSSRNFTLGAMIVRRYRRAMQPYDNEFNEGMDAEVSFDNKVLVDGQEYKAFVRACVFQADHSTSNGPDACASSDWSSSFGPDRELPPTNPVLVKAMQDYAKDDAVFLDQAERTAKRGHSVFGYSFAGNDLFVVAAAAVIIGLALIAVICIAFGCFMRRKRRPKLHNHVDSTDPTLKQPLIRMNDCGPSKETNNIMCTSGIDLLANTLNTHNSVHLTAEQRNSILTSGHGSLSGNHIIPSSPPIVPHASLLNSMTTAGTRNCMTNSGAPSPLTGLAHSEFASSQRFNIVAPHFTNVYQESGVVHGNLQNSINSFGPGRVGGTLSSHAGSHPNSLIGAASGTGALGSNFNSEPGDDSLIIGHNHLNGGHDFVMSGLAYENKGPFMRQPIPIHCLADHVSRLTAADNLLFAQEYESIETECQFTWEHSNMEVNKTKNRYANVIAYDHSRVILQSIDGIPGSDYINANYIDGYKRPNAYIATQGPMPDTYSDFWRMIWEQRVYIIVMMTRLEERARVKCDQYWPSRGPESYAGGLLTVTPIETIELAYYTIRTFNLVARGIDDECREVRHFQFTSWPDHGVPEYPIPLLLFIRRVRSTMANSSAMTSSGGQASLAEHGPIVVHCSAGVGRTGAFIVVDMMLERIKYEKTVDIYGCVKALRAQRNFMVQTEDQYIFIHSALLEAIDAGNTEVPARNLLAHVRKLRMLDTTGGSGMELEFQQLQQFRLPRAKYTSAQLLCNRSKNRLPNALPYESTRVVLQPIRGVEGSDYINASFIDSYRDRKAYVATQGPLAKTVEDFWRMIWEYNSTIVVMLSKFVERGQECCYPYWPSERSARYQYYVVDPMVEYNMPNYTLREFKLTDARDGHSRTLRQFQFMDWPEQGVPSSCEAFIEFLGQVHKTKEQFGQDGPITVHCCNGVGRTGVFLALSIVLDRMRSEGIVDMFQTVRMLRTQRYGLVESEEEYRFCYNAALEYLSSFDHYVST